MVLNREANYEISLSNNIIRAWWLKQGLHDTPDLLREKLQEQIDIIEKEQADLSDDKKFDSMCLGYGLCSNGVVGLESRSTPLVVPKCDDCISLFLGSQNKYLEIFNEKPGIYWFNPGWIENAFTPSEENYQIKYKEYVEKFGEENGEYLMEAENNWIQVYQHLIYIDSPVYQSSDYIDYTKSAAEYLDCQFSMEQGDMSFIRELLNGPWRNERFLICPPCHRITRMYDDNRIGCELI
jgi:hypothetical protein